MKEMIKWVLRLRSGRCLKRSCKGLSGIVLLVILQACGGGAQISLEGENPIIGSRFSPTLLIPERYGGDKAFVQTATPPVLGAFVFHLDSFTSPMRFDFFDMYEILKQGVVDGMALAGDRDLAFVTVSSGVEGVFVFNPAEGFRLYTSFSFTGAQFSLPEVLPDSDGNPVSSVQPVYTAGSALMQGKVYLPTSNYTRFGGDPACAPGTVIVADFDADPPRFTNPGAARIIVTTDFNPTEVTPLTDRILLVTNTGVLDIQGGKGVPLTDGSVDVVDTKYDCIVANYPLGLAAPSFSRIAVVKQKLYEDGTVCPEDGTVCPEDKIVLRGYLGSAAYNHVYELDLTGLEEKLPDEDPGICPALDSDDFLTDKVLAPLRDPILATKHERKKTPNFIYQVAVSHHNSRAYATGFDSGTLAVLEVGTTSTLNVETGRYLPDESPKKPLRVIQVTDALPSLNETSPGPVAARPGVPCDVAQEDGCFYGPDVFVVTGSPIGEMRSVRTY